MTGDERLSILLAQEAERLRQEREAFKLHKEQQARWFRLRLAMGYSSILLLTSVLCVSSYVVLNHTAFSAEVSLIAAGALFADVLGLVVGVWKVVLNPRSSTRLQPRTPRPKAENFESPKEDTARQFASESGNPERTSTNLQQSP